MAFSTRLLLSICTLAGASQLGSGISITTTVQQTGGSCPAPASPTLTAPGRNMSSTESGAFDIANKVLNDQGAVYDWTGCFIELTDSLSNSLEFNISSLTPTYCANNCADFQYFSLLQGSVCACGSQMPSILVSEQSNCNASCPGNSSEVCGGDGYLQIYEKEPCLYGCRSSGVSSYTIEPISSGSVMILSSPALSTISAAPISSTTNAMSALRNSSSNFPFTVSLAPKPANLNSSLGSSTPLTSAMISSSVTKSNASTAAVSSSDIASSVLFSPSASPSRPSALLSSTVAYRYSVVGGSLSSTTPAWTSTSSRTSSSSVHTSSFSRQSSTSSPGSSIITTRVIAPSSHQSPLIGSSPNLASSSHSLPSSSSPPSSTGLPSSTRSTSSSKVTALSSHITSSSRATSSIYHTAFSSFSTRTSIASPSPRTPSSTHSSLLSSTRPSTLSARTMSTQSSFKPTSLISFQLLSSASRVDAVTPTAPSTSLGPSLTSSSRLPSMTSSSTTTIPFSMESSSSISSTIHNSTKSASASTISSSSTTQNGGLLLSSPTTLVNTAADESQYLLTLPFNLTLYTETSPNISITTNGLLSITTGEFTDDGYIDTPQALYSYIVAPGTAMPWWHYMYSDGQNYRGIYYQIDNNNHLSVEYLLLDGSAQLTHFIVTYSAQSPGNINFYYLTTGDGGANSTTGVQGNDDDGNNEWLQVANGTASAIQAGTLLRFTTPATLNSNGTWSQDSSFEPSCFPAGSFPTGTCGTPAD